MGKLVLVVAEETTLRAKIARWLQPAGYAVELAASEKRALELVARKQIDATIAVSGSGLAGLAFVRLLSDMVPSLILLVERSDDIAGLGRSLPDINIYPSQPLDRQQLLDRLAEVMASSRGDETAPAPADLRIGHGRIDFAGRTFIPAEGREVALTRAESLLLMAFARNPGRVMSRDQLKSCDCRAWRGAVWPERRHAHRTAAPQD